MKYMISKRRCIFNRLLKKIWFPRRGKKCIFNYFVKRVTRERIEINADYVPIFSLYGE
jgi:hypothetical protein